MWDADPSHIAPLVPARGPLDAPPPGIDPVAVDQATGEAFYLSSVPLPVALDMARAARGR